MWERERGHVVKMSGSSVFLLALKNAIFAPYSKHGCLHSNSTTIGTKLSACRQTTVSRWCNRHRRYAVVSEQRTIILRMVLIRVPVRTSMSRTKHGHTNPIYISLQNRHLSRLLALDAAVSLEECVGIYPAVFRRNAFPALNTSSSMLMN